MWIFAEFWYNRLVNDALTATNLLSPVGKVTAIYRFITKDSNNVPINGSSPKDVSFAPANYNEDATTSNDSAIMKSSVQYCFDNKFLPFLLNRINSENPGALQ